MNIVFFASGRGSGHAVRAASIFFAIKRAGLDFDFSMISNIGYNHLIASYFPNHIITMQPELFLCRDDESELYHALETLCPDVLVVDGIWLPLLPILNDFTFKKIILFRQFDDWWFSVSTKKYGLLEFQADQYDRVFSKEPGFIRDNWESINPLMIMNHDEILPRSEARKLLGAEEDRKLCVFALNGFEGEFEELKSKIIDFETDYQIIETSNRKGGGFFPLVKYAHGIDLLIAGAGYTTFYETRYFNIPAELFPLKRKNENMEWRMRTNKEYTFDRNGADELVEIIQGL